MTEHTWERVKEPDDPNRCQAVISNGQCLLVACEGSKYCPCHGGNKAIRAAEANEKRIYMVGKFRARLDRHVDHSELKSLREEIGVLRLLIEERLNSCKTDNDLLLYSGPLADLIMKVEKLVTSCNKMEEKLGKMLDQNQALQLSQEIVEIIAKHLKTSLSKDDLITAVEAGISDLPELQSVGDLVTDLVTSVVVDVKDRDDILEGIANDIAEAIDRLSKPTAG